MNTLVLERAFAPRSSGGWQRFGAWMQTWWRQPQRRRALTEIWQLDAHLLRDIGISEADIQDAFDGRSSSILFEPFRGGSA